LELLKIEPGNIVLVPEFICVEALSAFYTKKCNIKLYPINHDLSIDINKIDFLDAKIFFFANYFGFTQQINELKNICRHKNITMIEDNAHGFLSKDESGTYLGTRCDLGIFSFRKTIPAPNGGGLYFNPNSISLNINSLNKQNISNKSTSFKIKNSLRHLTPIIGAKGWIKSIMISRKFKKLLLGYEIPKTNEEELYFLKNEVNRCEIENYIANVDIITEIERRRNLYKIFENKLIKIGAISIFKELPVNTSPYVYPFYYNNDEHYNKINKLLHSLGAEAFKWPELPKSQMHKEKYQHIGCVRFLW